MTDKPGLRARYDDIIRRLDEPKLGNPKYMQDRVRIEYEMRALCRAALAETDAHSHPHDGYAYDGCLCVCCVNIRALAGLTV